MKFPKTAASLPCSLVYAYSLGKKNCLMTVMLLLSWSAGRQKCKSIFNREISWWKISALDQKATSFKICWVGEKRQMQGKCDAGNACYSKQVKAGRPINSLQRLKNTQRAIMESDFCDLCIAWRWTMVLDEKFTITYHVWYIVDVIIDPIFTDHVLSYKTEKWN